MAHQKTITFSLYDLPTTVSRQDLIRTLARAMRMYVQNGYGDDEDRAISASLDDEEERYRQEEDEERKHP